MAKQNRFTKSARGEECTLMIYPYCSGDIEKTVLCHINCEDKGTSIKSPDFFAVFGCSDCHDIIDGKRQVELSKVEIIKCIQRGLYRTWKRWIELGVVKL